MKKIAGLLVFLAISTLTIRSAIAGGRDFDWTEATCQELKPTLADLNRVEDPTQYDGEGFTRWFEPPSGEARAVGVVAHGLNMKPSTMEPLIRLLNAHGIAALRIGLSGHRGNLDEFKAVTRAGWLKEMFLSYCVARERADAIGAPLEFVGFSLGALLEQDLLNTPAREAIHFDREVLLAPPISVRPETYLVNLFRIFGPGWLVPSMTPEEYRANPGTSMAAYEALFESIAAIRKQGLAHSRFPTLLLIDPRDELVSMGGIASWIRDDELEQWRLERVDTSGTVLPRHIRHLIIDDRALGPREWSRASSLISAFL